MASVFDSLKAISGYPIPQRTLVDVVEGRGLVGEDIATIEVRQSAGYQLAKADLYMWLADAPTISQGGQSYSLSDTQRKQYRDRANTLYRANGEVQSVVGATYGYKGPKL